MRDLNELSVERVVDKDADARIDSLLIRALESQNARWKSALETRTLPTESAVNSVDRFYDLYHNLRRARLHHFQF